MSSRRTARKNAFIVLYQSDVTGRPVEDALARWRSYRGEVDAYMARLARGVEERGEELDERIGEAAVGWTVGRMSAIDRNILRLSLYEMLYVEDVPPEVAVNEGMELAKGFSSEEAPQFVGGVLRGARPSGPAGAPTGHEERRASFG
ncbi:transcription antitermination factor NusB [Rubrobacter marinus]|uniref:Transcription antitermination protein NusB n=1 Tax=Rubrobacter marinus TaxID=2653852 RepID=A0A6G8PXB8_9ACTN|nr:transcription antitermination factor NusB [Rubrobacter marinus]QIN78869.1 transcription antitermination factor NusB [Rubrobacter marinus]